MTTRRLDLDVVLFGGGVAGLWMLNRLRARGYRALLLEAHQLGAGQSISSQAIIHGGTKYTLRARLTESSEHIAAMPGLWRSCLEGHGPIDLRGVHLLSRSQWLWAAGGAASDLATFLASRVMRSRVRAVEPLDRPSIFRDSSVGGRVFELDEPVLDARSLIESLAAPHRSAIVGFTRCSDIELHSVGSAGDAPRIESITLKSGSGDPLKLFSRWVIFSSGAGNEEWIRRLRIPSIATQRRPLHMVMARGCGLPLVYAHAIRFSDVPWLTITSARDSAGRAVWYLGGDLAEKGIDLDAAAQRREAARRIGDLFPSLDLTEVEWSTLRIDRAEPKQRGGGRPDSAVAAVIGNAIIAWPTKLALAPALSSEVEAIVGRAPAKDTPIPAQVLDGMRQPDVAPLPWEEPREWRSVPSAPPV